MNIFKSSLLVILILLISCSDMSKDMRLNEYLKKNNINVISEKIIFVISENSCLSCNKRFSEYASLQERENIIYILTATGGMFNTEVYDSKHNVIYDFNGEIHLLDILSTSGVIVIDDNQKIDTIIKFSYSNIEDVINTIDNLYLK